MVAYVAAELERSDLPDIRNELMAPPGYEVGQSLTWQTCILGTITISQAVRRPLSGIMNRNYDIPTFARHLDAFCQESRGPVLIKEGQPRRYRYRFAVPLLRAFILLKGVAEHRITPDELR